MLRAAVSRAYRRHRAARMFAIWHRNKMERMYAVFRLWVNLERWWRRRLVIREGWAVRRVLRRQTLRLQEIVWRWRALITRR